VPLRASIICGPPGRGEQDSRVPWNLFGTGQAVPVSVPKKEEPVQFILELEPRTTLEGGK